MPWFSILSGALKLAGLIAGYLKDRQLMDAGEQKQISKMLKVVSVKAGVSKDIELETAKMTPEQVLRDLQEAGELRD